MACVAKGLSRQDAHEEIRPSPHPSAFSPFPNPLSFTNISFLLNPGVLSHQASDNVKKQGKSNDLIERIRRTEFFAPIIAELDGLLDPSTFIGRAPQQVEKFVATEVEAALQPYKKSLVNEVAELYV
jgi:adenylosuccinate lyase